jgi:putative transposase
MVCCVHMNYPHKHTIALSRSQKRQINSIIRKGNHNARVLVRARALLKSSRGATDEEIANEEGVHSTTIERVRRRYNSLGLEGALYDAPRPGQPRKLDSKSEKYLIAMACTDPPEGANHWTLELLAEKMVKDKKVKTISSVAVMHYLHANDTKPWREKNVVHTEDHAIVH